VNTEKPHFQAKKALERTTLCTSPKRPLKLYHHKATGQRNAYGYRDEQYFNLRILNFHNQNYALVGRTDLHMTFQIDTARKDSHAH